MNMERLARLPDWPARMTASVAAAYMGVSQTTFLTRYRHLGVAEGGNVFWARRQLDALIANQFGLSQASSPIEERDTSWDDLA